MAGLSRRVAPWRPKQGAARTIPRGICHTRKSRPQLSSKREPREDRVDSVRQRPAVGSRLVKASSEQHASPWLRRSNGYSENALQLKRKRGAPTCLRESLRPLRGSISSKRIDNSSKSTTSPREYSKLLADKSGISVASGQTY